MQTVIQIFVDCSRNGAIGLKTVIEEKNKLEEKTNYNLYNVNYTYETIKIQEQ